jgi:hypothetical protein
MSRPLRRRRISTLLVLAGFAACATVGVLPSGCSSTPTETNPGPTPAGPGVGDPCVPPDELEATFSGFSIAQEYIVASDYFSCNAGICLVNHFQGRVTCPLGQTAPMPCAGPADTTTCGAGATCVSAELPADACDPAADAPCGNTGRFCDPALKVCKCTSDAGCGEGAACGVGGRCVAFVCSAGGCQQQGQSDAVNAGKACCVPGTTTPVTAPVCGACDAPSHRNADAAVYCSCRCAPAEGAPAEPEATFCACPAGFACTEIRKYLGVGDDPSLAGSYCVREGTQYTSSNTCGLVHGNADPSMCHGIAAP